MSKTSKPAQLSGKQGGSTTVTWAGPLDPKTAGHPPVDSGGIEMPAELLEEFGLTVWEADFDPDMDAAVERRGFPRIYRGVFLDQEIAIYTNNLTKNVPSRDVLLDVSACGLLFVSGREKELGDILRLEFRMGGEKYIMKGEVMRRNERTYGVRFIDPTPEIVESIERLYGSARLNKAHRGQHRS